MGGCTIPAIVTLKARSQFLAIRGGTRASTPAFLMEGRPQTGDSAAVGTARFGFTVTKKLGNAVRRNRIRRRLKAAITERANSLAHDGFDYVIVARPAAFDRPYGDLLADVTRALTHLHSPRASNPGKPPRTSPPNS